MPGQTPFVQPIALLRPDEAEPQPTHEDAIRAAALASVTAFIKTSEDPAWEPWLASAFAKSVRRAKPKPFERAEDLAAAKIVVGNAQALAFLPTSYEAMSPLINKMQVQGTDFQSTGWPEPEPVDHLAPRLLINDGLAMTTGKAAAQAAHGLFLWFLQLEPEDQSAWIDRGQPFSLLGATQAQFTAQTASARVIVRDAGFTEVAPHSSTVAVL